VFIAAEAAPTGGCIDDCLMIVGVFIAAEAAPTGGCVDVCLFIVGAASAAMNAAVLIAWR
jgi:hypothetical protein